MSIPGASVAFSGHSKKFIDLFTRLPERVKKLTVKKCHTWRTDRNYPSLEFYSLGSNTPKVFRISIGDHYRALASEEIDRDQKYYLWFWIGTHEEYNKLIKRHT